MTNLEAMLQIPASLLLWDYKDVYTPEKTHTLKLCLLGSLNGALSSPSKHPYMCAARSDYSNPVAWY